jgi:uncharacterized protein YndB with AHSA1/START domain
VFGELEQLRDGRWQLRFTRTFRQPRQRVWRAITEPEQLARWFPTTIEGARAAGAPLRFSFPQGQAEPFTGEVLAYEEGSAFELRWGDDILRLELREVPDGTELTLLDTLDQRGKAARDGAGWHICLDALEAELYGRQGARAKLDAWRDVNHEYVQRFGPEAATIGPPDGFEDNE